MLLAAREALSGPDAPRLIAVTLLTSIDSRALADLPMAGHPEGIVRRLSVLARECGLDGVVC
jgi:orotidine-5'-phosphate decarboxylase